MNIQLSRRRQYYSAVKYLEKNEELILILQDSDETSRLTKQIFLGHIGAMLSFVTVCLALPAWLFAAANIFLSPKAAFVHLRFSKENLVLSRHYIRFAVEKLLVPAPVSIGPKLLGRGEAEPPITIPYSDIESLDWNGFAFELRLKHQENIIVNIQNASASDMEIILEKTRSYIQKGIETDRLPEEHSLSFEKKEKQVSKKEVSKKEVPSINSSLGFENENKELNEKELNEKENNEKENNAKQIKEEVSIVETHNDDLPALNTVIEEIKQRSSQLLSDDNYDQYKGKIYSLRLKLERIAPTFDFQLEEKYKGGKSLIGKLDGINIVAYQQNQIEISEESIGKEVHVRVSFYEWKSILQQVIVKIV